MSGVTITTMDIWDWIDEQRVEMNITRESAPGVCTDLFLLSCHLLLTKLGDKLHEFEERPLADRLAELRESEGDE